MERHWQNIIDNKRNPVHWLPVALLWLISLGYRLVLYFHERFLPTPVTASCPVISVGNLTVGGTGKTPVTIMLAQYLVKRKKTVAIVSGGYGRKGSDNVIAIGRKIRQCPVAEVGDEVVMMAESLPDVIFAVGRSKSEMALKLRERNPDVIIIDDGFQHRRLHRDFNVLLFDAGCDICREALFPLGRLRETLRAIARADCVILNHGIGPGGEADLRMWFEENHPGLPLSEIGRINENIVTNNLILPLKDIKGKRIYALAGIGNGDAFIAGLTARLGDMAGFRLFGDHCAYTDADISHIRADIEELQPDCMLTTHKDYVKLRGFDFGVEMYYVDLSLKFRSGKEEFFDCLRRKIER